MPKYFPALMARPEQQNKIRNECLVGNFDEVKVL